VELETRLQTLGTEHEALQGRAATLSTELERDRAALAQARSQAGAEGLRVQRREAELETLQARFRTHNAALLQCSRHNQSLREVSLELLQRWQRMDWRDAMAAKEPFVQGERVRIENLVQGYEEQIDRASLVAPTAPDPARRAGSPQP
jgi:chromosome segregation ATPase